MSVAIDLSGRSLGSRCHSLQLQHQLADRLLWRKIRAFFGGRVRYFIVGAAPTPKDVLTFFWAAGMPILEAYGMTEATAITHANTMKAVKLGTVGRLLDGLEQRIAEDGELLVRGPWVFKGYFRNPEATAATVIDGWLHTGDVGVLDPDGYLRITDRKSTSSSPLAAKPVARQHRVRHKERRSSHQPCHRTR